jgi:hypothetical protein
LPGVLQSAARRRGRADVRRGCVIRLLVHPRAAGGGARRDRRGIRLIHLTRLLYERVQRSLVLRRIAR